MKLALVILYCICNQVWYGSCVRTGASGTSDNSVGNRPVQQRAHEEEHIAFISQDPAQNILWPYIRPYINRVDPYGLRSYCQKCLKSIPGVNRNIVRAEFRPSLTLVYRHVRRPPPPQQVSAVVCFTADLDGYVLTRAPEQQCVYLLDDGEPNTYNITLKTCDFENNYDDEPVVSDPPIGGEETEDDDDDEGNSGAASSGVSSGSITSGRPAKVRRGIHGRGGAGGSGGNYV